MLLTIDMGNTNLTLGLYEGSKLGARWRLATDHERMPDEYGLQILGMLQHGGCSPAQLHGVCLASVVPPLTGRLVKACEQFLGQQPFVIDSSVHTGIKILYDDPAAVGADRIVDAVAVRQLYGGRPAWSILAPPPPLTPSPPRVTTWAGQLPPASASPPRLSFSALPNCRGLTCSAHPM